MYYLGGYAALRTPTLPYPTLPFAHNIAIPSYTVPDPSRNVLKRPETS